MAIPLIPVAITGLGSLLAYAVASGVGQGIAKFMLGIGVGFVAYQGADVLVTQNEEQVLDLLGTLPPLAVSMMGVLKIGTCIKIMFSAMLMRMTMFGLNEGVIKRMRVTGPASPGV